eukprot:986085-Rhodomonas_salina.1
MSARTQRDHASSLRPSRVSLDVKRQGARRVRRSEESCVWGKRCGGAEAGCEGSGAERDCVVGSREAREKRVVEDHASRRESRVCVLKTREREGARIKARSASEEENGGSEASLCQPGELRLEGGPDQHCAAPCPTPPHTQRPPHPPRRARTSRLEGKQCCE